MFQRLVKHNYWKKSNCILVSMGGVPTRACRRFIRRLSETKKIPVYAFTDSLVRHFWLLLVLFWNLILIYMYADLMLIDHPNHHSFPQP